MSNEERNHSLEKMQQKKEETNIVRKIVLRVVLIVLVIGLMSSVGTYFYIQSGLKPVNKKAEDPISVEIPTGAGVNTISKVLKDAGVIRNAKIFKYYAKFNNESQFKAGTYQLTQAMTLDEIIQSLKTGMLYREPLFTVTIPEGLTLEQIAAVIEKNTAISAEDFMNYVSDPKTIAQLKETYPTIITDAVDDPAIRYPLEGYLFPATYPFFEEAPPVEEVVDQMIQATAVTVTPYLDRLTEQERSVHWLLTFAAMLEREATAQADRATIASVFYNRMDEGMPLQTDPTVLYALGEHKSKTLLKDLEVENPYNTYKNKGVPPGPIAAPGKSSIDATMNPEETPYLFFLADKDGVNHFSKTYEEHLQKKAKYIDNQ